MKKITVLLLALLCTSMLMAQSKFARVPIKMVPANAIKNQLTPSQPGNATANTKATLEDIIGNTWYDMQTNGAIDPRLTVYPNGSMAGVWIRGTTNSNDRGTGYNYFNGTSWAPEPTARIENDRTGWPSYAPLGPTGEIVIAHLNDGLKISSRTIKGQGTWNQSVLMGPAGATDISWPRIITNGTNHNCIHMLATTYVTYQGLTPYALLYYRSLDAGQTWDKLHVILPQLTSTDYDGFNGDEYAWGTPHGDTIYFAVSGPWLDTFIMQSNDNGNTWNKIPVLSNANKKLPAGTTEVLPFASSDGAVAVEMDNSGVFHVAFGIGGGSMTGGTKYITINANGLVYWNSTMPMVKDSLDLDTLEAHGQLLGAVYNGPATGDTIVAAPSYRVGLSSFPQISVDNYNNLYFLWSAVKPGNPSPDPFNYRHIWGRAKFHNKQDMTEMIDLNGGVMYLFNEFVYPTMAKRILNDKLEVIYQSAPEPGSNIVDATIAAHECKIEHRQIPGSTFWFTGISNPNERKNQVGQNYPNPAKGLTSFNVNLTKTSSVIVEVSNLMGQKLMTFDKGICQSGAQKFTIDASSFSSGIYFYTVKIDGESYTHKMIVE
ncbi:MAG: T9SS type A sorting domain-containing protein [Bacteroidetes bacterium]|nr:T9SS type A sorting domain-containing protein [Bacteroidota bacterium]